jgi:pimeloyl-ACP methyl ester carboxylesterase
MTAEHMVSIPVDGGRIAYRRTGNGRPLLILNGLAATNGDWDPAFLERLASANELILLDNCGIGASTDNGDPFDIAKLARDTKEVIQALDLQPACVLGWSMGGFIAQALAVDHPTHVDKLILLSTDPGGSHAQLASPAVRTQLTDTSGTPHEQARRLLALLFPDDFAESVYQEFGDLVAEARARLSPGLVERQAAAIDAWHRNGVGDRLGELKSPALIATGTDDRVIPSSNALTLANAIPGAWLVQVKGGGHAFMAQYPHPLGQLVNEFLAL